MARPIVLVATTNPIMAYALQERLKEDCKTLGLKLEVCPDGDESDVPGAEVRAYDSAEALFDALEKRNPVELADTLVVLDIGTELENAFRPAASKDQGWHVTARRAGIAVELLLRFPQVFHVFLSPAVPIAKIAGNARHVQDTSTVEKISTASREWKSFRQLINSFSEKTKPSPVNSNGPSSQLITGFAFQTPLHFVSPLDAGLGLVSTLARFARGMRCWFDPTGLRTLVKNCFLGTLFGKGDWANTETQRESLRKRLDNVVISIDEEREFALLSAYTAYRYGSSAWLVTTFEEFENKPLWVSSETNKSNDVVVLRDIDLRFPDIPDKPPRGTESVRDQLKFIGSEIWTLTDTGKHRLDKDKCFVRVVSSNPGVSDSWINYDSIVKRLGQYPPEGCPSYKNVKYHGLKKPIGTIFELEKLLSKEGLNLSTLITEITPAKEPTEEPKLTGGHGAPYLNLSMSASLLFQSRLCNGGETANLIGALLALEAYELLLGMSTTTALEALLLLHKKEVAAEIEFPGISHDIKIEKRKHDIEKTIYSLLCKDKSNNEAAEATNKLDKVGHVFLSQFWAELRVIYRNGEHFQAAEEANSQSLIHSDWLDKFQKLSNFIGKKPSVKHLLNRSKGALVRVATSPLSWAKANLLSMLMAFVFYVLVGWYNGYYKTITKADLNLKALYESVVTALELFLSVGLSSITLQPMWQVDNILKQVGACGHIVAILHLGAAYILFGVLISMLYRKITRS